ncbi:hypothetical protein CWO89_01930 [Bradyrhizobium sp. Leo170]|nr:hypothetical protein CWO89_01930 [Bradyrhizobium sp. Leo170]
MKTILLAISTAAILVTPAVAQNAGTKFRGVYINMPKTEADGLSNNFTLKWEKDLFAMTKEEENIPVLAVYSKTGKHCGSVKFDKNGTAKSADFYRCFFDAESLPPQQFAEAILKNYKLPELSCALERNLMGEALRTCKGLLQTGEEVSITSPTNSSDEPGIHLKRGSGTPKFD